MSFPEGNPESPILGNTMEDLSALELDLELRAASHYWLGPPPLFAETPAAADLVKLLLRNISKAIRSTSELVPTSTR